MRFLTLLLALIIGCAPIRHSVQNDYSSEPSDPGASSGAAVTDPNSVAGKVMLIRFNTEVDALSTGIAIAAIYKANREGAKAIVIEFDTPGGSVKAGFALSKAIEESTVPLTCVVDGEADSMGFYMLQSCPVRLMTKRSVLMAHQPAIGGQLYGPTEQWKNLADLLKALEWAMIEHMVARSKITGEEMLKRIEGGKMWWMDYREALYLGFVDNTVESVQKVVADLN